jgi:hypothetical protein
MSRVGEEVQQALILFPYGDMALRYKIGSQQFRSRIHTLSKVCSLCNTFYLFTRMLILS